MRRISLRKPRKKPTKKDSQREWWLWEWPLAWKLLKQRQSPRIFSRKPMEVAPIMNLRIWSSPGLGKSALWHCVISGSLCMEKSTGEISAWSTWRVLSSKPTMPRRNKTLSIPSIGSPSGHALELLAWEPEFLGIRPLSLSLSQIPPSIWLTIPFRTSFKTGLLMGQCKVLSRLSLKIWLTRFGITYSWKGPTLRTALSLKTTWKRWGTSLSTGTPWTSGALERTLSGTIWLCLSTTMLLSGKTRKWCQEASTATAISW